MTLLNTLMGGSAQPQRAIPLASMIASNPVGTETTQQLSMPSPDFQPGVQWGPHFMSAPHYAAAQNAMGNALGWVGTFGGPSAKTADLGKLAQAQELAANGAARDHIWEQTGWFEGPEGNWRFEIPDNSIRAYGMNNVPWGTPDTMRLAAVIDHPELFQAYPQLKNLGVAGGGFSNKGVYQRSMEGIPGQINIAPIKNPESTFVHEIQHAIQDIEGNTQGGSAAAAFSARDLAPHATTKYEEIVKKTTTPVPYEEYARLWGEDTPEAQASYQQYLKGVPKSIPLSSDLSRTIQETAAQDVYKRIYGEIEARNAAARMNMSPQTRADIPPWYSQDITDPAQYIVRPVR